MANIGQELNREWDQLVRSAEGRRALRRWTRRWPALAGCRDLHQVLERRRDRPRAQEVLRPLAVMAPDDVVVARTLLQALVPGLVALARSVASDDPSGLDEIVAIAWERIRTYPGHREGSVAGNVLLDVRKRYLKQRGFGVVCPEVVPPDDRLQTIPGSFLHPDRDLVSGFLRAAIDSGVLTREELDTLVRSRMYDVPLHEIAEERGVTARALGQQRWRAEDRLRRMPEAAQVMSWSAA